MEDRDSFLKFKDVPSKDFFHLPTEYPTKVICHVSCDDLVFVLIQFLYFHLSIRREYEDRFCLGLPPGCTYRALHVGHVHAFSTRIQQSFERQPR